MDAQAYIKSAAWVIVVALGGVHSIDRRRLGYRTGFGTLSTVGQVDSGG